MLIQGKRIEKDLYKKVSSDLGIDPEIVEKVNMFQFKLVKQSWKKNKTIELTDFGSFKPRINIVVKEIKKLEEIKLAYEKQLQTSSDPEKLSIAEKHLENIKEKLEFLNSKL